MFFHSAEFRYEGIMLIHKNSSIRSLSDLRGKKSCHTGYGRNVGYKIPITKLRKHGIIQISTDQYLPSLERELKGLSELFTQSCIVGRFSPNDEINRLYSKNFYFFSTSWSSFMTLFQKSANGTFGTLEFFFEYFIRILFNEYVRTNGL